MTRFAYNIHRAVAGVFLIAIVFSAVNYYLDFGFLGQRSKLVLILVVLLFAIYGALFAPTRQEMRDQRETRRISKNL